jgi:hypothetical protein
VVDRLSGKLDVSYGVTSGNPVREQENLPLQRTWSSTGYPVTGTPARRISHVIKQFLMARLPTLIRIQSCVWVVGALAAFSVTLIWRSVTAFHVLLAIGVFFPLFTLPQVYILLSSKGR